MAANGIIQLHPLTPHPDSPIMPASIEVTNLTKRYGSLTAVDNISFAVQRGDLRRLGPNGAGKTTTLEMIEGLKRPTSGDIHVEGRDVRKEPNAVKAIIGVQLQGSSFFENLTLAELIHVFAACYSRKVDARRQLAEVQLTEKAGTRPENSRAGRSSGFPSPRAGQRPAGPLSRRADYRSRSAGPP